MLRFLPLQLAASCVSALATSASTGRRQLRGVQLDSQQFDLFQPNGMYAPAPAAAPMPALPTKVDRETPPELLKDIPEPPPPPAQPPPQPPIPPLPPAEGTLVGHPPSLPYELSIYPESATASDEESVEAAEGGMGTGHGSGHAMALAFGTSVDSKLIVDAPNLTLELETTTTHHPPITPPHAPMHAADAPPEPPISTTTMSHTLFPPAVTVDPACAEEVAKALAAVTSSATTTTAPKNCASYCNGVCIEEKTRELSGGGLETVNAQGPCYEKAAAVDAVEPLAVPEPPPPLPEAVDFVGLQRASRLRPATRSVQVHRRQQSDR